MVVIIGKVLGQRLVQFHSLKTERTTVDLMNKATKEIMDWIETTSHFCTPNIEPLQSHRH
jgi:hypothetical protein